MCSERITIRLRSFACTARLCDRLALEGWVGRSERILPPCVQAAAAKPRMKCLVASIAASKRTIGSCVAPREPRRSDGEASLTHWALSENPGRDATSEKFAEHNVRGAQEIREPHRKCASPCRCDARATLTMPSAASGTFRSLNPTIGSLARSCTHDVHENIDRSANQISLRALDRGIWPQKMWPALAHRRKVLWKSALTSWRVFL